MLQPSMQTLKNIVVNIYYYGGDDLLSGHGILSMFEDMRTKNIIETVTIRIHHTSRELHVIRGLIITDDWGRLDEVLTSTGWFSLKRVSLNIVFNFKVSKNELKVTLQNLIEKHFLRLSSSNSVSFDLMVTDKFES